MTTPKTNNTHTWWRESGLYAALWTACIFVFGYLLDNIALEWSLETLFAIGALPAWLCTSFLFAKITSEGDFRQSFIDALTLGFASFCYTLFFAYAFAELLLAWINLEQLFVYWWNIFSGGSSNFIVAFVSLLPTFVVVAVIVMAIIVITFMLAQIILCFLSRWLMSSLQVSEQDIEI